MSEKPVTLNILCGCTNPDHVLRFTLEPGQGSERPEVYATVGMRTYNSWWKRLKLSLRYIFTPHDLGLWGHWDEIVVHPDDMDQLSKFVTTYRLLYKLREKQHKLEG